MASVSPMALAACAVKVRFGFVVAPRRRRRPPRRGRVVAAVGGRVQTRRPPAHPNRPNSTAVWAPPCVVRCCTRPVATSLTSLLSSFRGGGAFLGRGAAAVGERPRGPAGGAAFQGRARGLADGDAAGSLLHRRRRCPPGPLATCARGRRRRLSGRDVFPLGCPGPRRLAVQRGARQRKQGPVCMWRRGRGGPFARG